LLEVVIRNAFWIHLLLKDTLHHLFVYASPLSLKILHEKKCMAYKRKRNVRIENDAGYRVLRLEELDESQAEDYVPPSIDTGMEADEEKEVHLRKIIEAGTGDIPIPVIAEVDNPARALYTQFKPRSRYINWMEDARNEYLLDNEDAKLCEELGLSRAQFLSYIEALAANTESGDGVESRIRSCTLPKMLARDEKCVYASYVCFRKRVLKPNRRTRKCEENSKEKLDRIWAELNILNRLCELSMLRLKAERDLEEVKRGLIESACMVMKSSGKNTRKKIMRRILRRPRRTPKLKFFNTCNAINELVFDRFRIKSLKKRLYELREDRDISEIEIEAYALRKHNELYGA
jgi:hypothetical protein